MMLGGAVAVKGGEGAGPGAGAANRALMKRLLMVHVMACSIIFVALSAAGGEPVVLQGMDRYRVMEACDESVRVVLTHRGEAYSPAYIQGISATAFMVAGPCPCAPTCGGALPPDKLLEVLGYEVERVSLAAEGTDLKAEGAKLVERVKAEIRAGRAAIVWHAFTSAEWDVVAGYDEGKHLFLGRGSYAGLDEYASADEMRLTTCGDICPALGAILVGERTRHFDARAAELAALRYAVRHARTVKYPLRADAGAAPVKWEFRKGLECYRWWAHNFRADPEAVPGVGDRYPLGIYCSTHRAAGEFMLELAAKYPEAKRHFVLAAGRFEHEADALDAIYGGLMEGWSGWQTADPAKAAEAARLLDRAAGYYEQGIREIERGLAMVEP